MQWCRECTYAPLLLHFRTNYNFPPDTNGYINIPANVLDISSNDADLIMRDWRLYSKSNQTAIFDEPKAMNVIWDMDFNSLTHPIRNFISKEVFPSCVTSMSIMN